jgi:hypothetical protein
MVVNINLKRKRLSNLSFSRQCLDVLLGSNLGDGSLTIPKKYVNARFSFRHSVKQSEWFYWKVEQLKEIGGIVQLQKPDGFSVVSKLHFQSHTNIDLTVIHSITRKNNKLIVTRSYLNHLSKKSLMIWWLDDGSLIKNGTQGCICCDSMSLKEQKIIVRYFRMTYEINAVIHKICKPNRSFCHRIYFYGDNLEKLLKIIIPLIPIKSMLYKALLRYKDLCIQQRWISEMKSLTLFPEEIEKLYQKENDIVQPHG